MPGAALIQLNRFGDLHQTLPVLNGLCERFGADHVVLVCCDDFAEALPPEGFRGIKAVLKRASLAKWASRLRLALQGNFPPESLQAELPECMQGPFDVTINLTHDEPSTALMALMESREQRGRIWSGKDDIRLTTDWAKYLFALVQNRQDNLFNLVDIQLGQAGLPHRPMKSWLQMNPASLAQAESLLRSQGWDGRQSLVAVQLGASDSFRALGPKKYAAALSLLSEKIDLQVVCMGTRTEAPLTEAFAEVYSGKTLALNGMTTMAQIPAVLTHCRLLISNDTGTLHAAASVGTPCLGIFFSTAYYTETAPYGAGHTILQAALPCSPCSSSNRCPEPLCRRAFHPEDMAAIAEWILHGKSGQPPGPFPDLDLMCSRFTDSGTLIYEPAPGWPMRAQYQKALTWRKIFEDHLIFRPSHLLNSNSQRDGASGSQVRMPVAQQFLMELVDALEDVANHLQKVIHGPESQEEDRKATRSEAREKATAVTFASRDQAQRAMEKLLRAQAQAQIWGRFIGFDLFDLPPDSRRSESETLAELQLRHREWAQRTREACL